MLYSRAHGLDEHGVWRQDHSGAWSLQTPFITDYKAKTFAEVPALSLTSLNQFDMTEDDDDDQDHFDEPDSWKD